MAYYIDLHCHILPGLDDGAPDLAASMEIMRTLAALGFGEICATPHQRNGLFIPTEHAIAAAMAELRGAMTASKTAPRLRLGAENYWDEVFVDRLRRQSVPSYDGRRAFLFEVNPVLPPPRLEEALFEIRLGGVLPVMAHPERCVPVQREGGFAETLSKQAALVVDLEALASGQSRAETKTARHLVEEGLAQAVASDMHGADTGPDVAAGLAWLRKRLGSAALARLLEENPRRILAGELP